jgi:Rrf2 family protein
MKLSTRTRYGLRAVIDIIVNSSKGPVLLKDIARRQDISFKYLDHIITSLKVAGFVKNAPGRHGGYAMIRPPEQVYVYEIIEALEGGLAFLDCSDDPEKCSRATECVMKGVYANARNALKESFRISIEELAKKQEKIYAEKNSRKKH